MSASPCFDVGLIPKPKFISANETSMRIHLPGVEFARAVQQADDSIIVQLQYIPVGKPWENNALAISLALVPLTDPRACVDPPSKRGKNQSHVMHVDSGELQVSVEAAALVDLEPGTAYAIRAVVKSTTTDECIIGPETVFDTDPIDCTPKKKNCIIC